MAEVPEQAPETSNEEEEPSVVLLQEDEDEDDDDEQVRRLAASFAPQVQELDALLASPPPNFGRSPSMSPYQSDEDDGLDSEEKRLEASEQLLRQELEFAQDWSALMASPLRQDHIAQELAVNYGIIQEEESPPQQPQQQMYTIASHAETLGLEIDSGWYVLPTTEEMEEQVLEYVVPLPLEQLKRLFIGLAGDDATDLLNPDYPATPVAEEGTQQQEENDAYHTPQHADPLTTPTSVPLTKRIDPLPARTLVIWIRPDVLCGAVMDAMYHALDNLGGETTKRQGGHLTGMVAPCVGPNENGELIQHAGYLVDAQLCTYKGALEHKRGQRAIVLRVYHCPYNREQDEDELAKETTVLSEPINQTANKVLKEAAALVQKMETGVETPTPRRSSFASLFSPTKQSMGAQEIKQKMSLDLLRSYRTCPSVQEGRLTLPPLSDQDAPLINASWRWIEACWEELESRDLCYSCLSTCRFGAFPALPTLDVHYCSQLRRLSREGMIVALLKSASELEEYAREAEYACANLIQMLRPTFDAYNIPPPALPQPLPLTAYPLDFQPPQNACPPWGLKVMEALNRVAAITSEANAREDVSKTSFEFCEEAIQMVMTAFQQQDDEEQGARLGRKNVQVMDRLAKMQAHKRASISALRDSYGRNPQVVQAADDFHCKAQQANDDQSPEDQVPLLKCSVLVRSSTGTCYVTSSQILFVTQFIPLVGGVHSTLFNLQDVDFCLQEGSSSLLSPLPTSISIRSQGETVYSFRPSHGAARLVAFLAVVKALAAPTEETELTFSEAGGLLYLFGDSPPPRRP